MCAKSGTAWSPALIAQCASTTDVVDVVNFARDHDLLVSVRGGVHNIAGKSVCERGLMIDLSRMNRVNIDRQRQTARVDGGAKLGDLDRATQAFGLATTAGVVSTTGVAGLTLGGGMGRLSTTRTRALASPRRYWRGCCGRPPQPSEMSIQWSPPGGRGGSR
jgi:FAD/FMN-containing dehydrogenase